jgi:cell division septation protein DedD
MDQKQRLFIYDRREVITLIMLGLMVAAFAFTLGIHLGKRVKAKGAAEVAMDPAQVPTLQDSVPNKGELTEQAKGAQAAADDELSQTLKSEVDKSKIKLNTPRQVQLPENTKSKNAGATTLQSVQKAEQDLEAARATPEKRSAADLAKYTLQVGSYPSENEAQEQVDSLRAHGLKPFLRSAQVKGLGTRFRLFVGGFGSREDAEKAGHAYQVQHVIHSYLVSNFNE